MSSTTAQTLATELWRFGRVLPIDIGANGGGMSSTVSLLSTRYSSEALQRSAPGGEADGGGYSCPNMQYRIPTQHYIRPIRRIYPNAPVQPTALADAVS